ncbi:gephyrin-like molybdotransferase Glp [Clostridium celatum]|uniref:Molybdopterin molybdenumtransferase n=1 Tax=Clostridium celatum DSM 1785 TaxID=545697 RepID=L1QFA3_9CLOT|nr:gephyrin-like molybdotransferase Glp [Clostridium celatum]EKY26335.1 molybdenum cofactor synthesis domain protein [Clostridium celatum DSM 1785]MCE9655787.1 molybdopterin molybdotransferase MoeA [Clostridium celatum]MDU2265876.1 molybdopterin molybdotransferase MoeA [Clostridium celatum]MDU3721929.1 molybdopterin molybdotransferase MoeA [Clostridium celatum]MDU6294250.1 molybdopterin molybdotransferase MoeA [Clostridium celatum]
MKSFISLEEAISILNENIKGLEAEEVTLIEAVKRVLAEDIYSKIDNPPFDKSAMDGYAVIANDSNSNEKINVIDKVFAGDICTSEVVEKTAIRIMTGAPIPKGANAVVKQEDVILDNDGYITLTKTLKENENICFKGEDIQKGTLLVKKNKRLDFADIGIIASTGIDKVKVYKMPRIALISTGDEVIDIENKLIEGKIFNSNKYTIISRVMELGHDVKYINHIKDSQGDIGAEIKKISTDMDLIITTGGVSVGEKDLLNEAINNIDGKRLFWKVKMKPGSAVLCSIVNNAVVISLSGNPTAALTGFELFVKTTLEKLLGRETLEIKREKAVLCDEVRKKSPQRRFIRGKAVIEDGVQNVYLTQVKSGNGILSSNLNSNCMIEVEAGNEGLKKGELVDIIKF